MPDVSEAPRRNLTIKGQVFQAPMPYEEGHEVTSNEASALNQTFMENLRNNFAGTVEKAQKEATENGSELDMAAMQKEFDSYTEGYEFGVRGGGREADPVRSKALQLAKDRIKAKIKEKGMKVSEVSTEKMNALAEQAIEKNPAFLEKAAEIVEAQKAAEADLTVDFE